MPTTSPPAAPNRYADPIVFSNAVDAFLAWMATGFAEGQYLLDGVAVPAVPADGDAILKGRTGVNITIPIVSMKNGLVRDLQLGLADNAYAIWSAAAGSTNLGSYGNIGTGIGATGTATAAFVSTANKYGRIPKTEYLVTVASTTAVAGFRTFVTFCTVGGPATGKGGFYFKGVWGPATGVSTTTNRAFFGFTNSVAGPTDVEPSTQVDCVGMSWDAADARVQIMHNDASGACTKISLGASFDVPTVDRTKLYELELYSPLGTTQTVYYLVTDLISGATASGTLSTNLPTTSTLLALRGYMSGGGTSSVIGFALTSMYLDLLI